MSENQPITIQPHLLYLRALDYSVMLLRDNGTTISAAIADDLCKLRKIITGQPYEIPGQAPPSSAKEPRT